MLRKNRWMHTYDSVTDGRDFLVLRDSTENHPSTRFLTTEWVMYGNGGHDSTSSSEKHKKKHEMSATPDSESMACMDSHKSGKGTQCGGYLNLAVIASSDVDMGTNKSTNNIVWLYSGFD